MIFNTTTPAGNAGGAYEEVTITGSSALSSLTIFYIDEQGTYQSYTLPETSKTYKIKVQRPSVFGIDVSDHSIGSTDEYVTGGTLCSQMSNPMLPGSIPGLAIYHI